MEQKTNSKRKCGLICLIFGDTMDKGLICSRKQLKEFLEQDAKANYRSTIKPKIFNDEIWKFIRCFRYLQYYDQARKRNKFIYIPFLINRIKYKKLAFKLGYDFSWTVEIGKGFSLPHYGSIVINSKAIIGENFKCHVGVNIGQTNGEKMPPHIGNNVYAGPGVKIIGDIYIADDVALGAGALVNRSIEESASTWGGVPAKKISDKNSHIHLSPYLDLK